MVHTLPDSDAKKQLIDKMSIASRRSSKFAKMLRDAELGRYNHWLTEDETIKHKKYGKEIIIKANNMELTSK